MKVPLKRWISLWREKKVNKKLKSLINRGLIVGKNFKFYDSYIDYGFAFLIEIGDDVTMTNASILSHDASTQMVINKTKVAKVKIGNNVFIGWGSIILPGVTIGNNIIIGAGTVVGSGSNIPDNSIVIGNPCKVVGSFDSFKQKHTKDLKIKPVFNTYWKNKTYEEKNLMIKELDGTYGYDE